MDEKERLDVANLLVEACRLLESDPRRAREITRQVLTRLEDGTERPFDHLPSFVHACLGYFPAVDQDPKDVPFFEPWDDARRRLVGFTEIVSGDRLTLTITALTERPAAWDEFTNRYFRNPMDRKQFAIDLTTGKLTIPKDATDA